MASFDINEVDSKDLTVPSDLFVFEVNGINVAEINMINPIKKNYTLYDFPETGVNTEMESYGGNLNRLLMNYYEQVSNIENPIINLIYTIADIVATDSTFTVVDNLHRTETQNYPLWNGEKLIHDPTFTIYYEPQGAPEEPPAIPGYPFYAILGMLGVTVIIKAHKMKSKGKFPT